MSNSRWFKMLCMALFVAGSANAQGLRLETLWSLAPGDRPYLSTGTEQRGLAYDPLYNTLILVNRRGGISMHALDPETGADLETMNTGGITGGTFALSKVGIAEDGFIYAANFGTIGTATPTFNIYRWESTFGSPTLVYAADPGAGNIQQWGTTFDVRGSADTTEILVSSSGGNIAALLTTPDGINFGSTVLRTDVLPGQMGISIAFGEGDTFWAKSVDGPLLHLSFDRAAGTATTLRTYDVTNFPGTVGPMEVWAARGLLGAINVTTPDAVNLYSIADLQAGPVLLSSTNTPTDNPNTLFMGAVTMGAGLAGDRLFALDSNNGLVAYRIVPSSDPIPPSMVLHPADRTVFGGSTVTLAASAAGTAPLSYQWLTNGVPIPGATNATYMITNVQTSHEGPYSVVVSNVAGVTTSFEGRLTVLPPGVMTPLWSLPPSSRTYLTGSGNNQRGLAYNPKTGHLLLVNRAGGLSINVIDALTGTNVGTMSTAGISGGTFILSKIEVADDGVIYGANFGSFPSTVFTIYRWADESAEPTLAFAGDPAGGAGNQQYGNSMALRGGGTNTQIIVPTQRDVAALFTTADGTNFTSRLITGLPYGGFYHGVAFGQGETIWGKTNTFPLVRVGFDPITGSSTVLGFFDASALPDALGPIAVDPAHNLLAGVVIASPDTINLYDISNPTNPPALLQAVRAPTDNANTLFQGAIDFGDGMLFALDTNNGLAAYILPVLKITRGNGNVVIRWPVRLTGFRLEANASLGSNGWTPVAGATLMDDHYTVTLTGPAGNRFFRLNK